MLKSACLGVVLSALIYTSGEASIIQRKNQRLPIDRERLEPRREPLPTKEVKLEVAEDCKFYLNDKPCSFIDIPQGADVLFTLNNARTQVIEMRAYTKKKE